MAKCQNCIITNIFYAYLKSLQNEFMTRNSLKCDLARARLCNGRMSSSGRIDRGESQANRICLITLSDFWGTESSFDQDHICTSYRISLSTVGNVLSHISCFTSRTGVKESSLGHAR